MSTVWRERDRRWSCVIDEDSAVMAEKKIKVALVARGLVEPGSKISCYLRQVLDNGYYFSTEHPYRGLKLVPTSLRGYIHAETGRGATWCGNSPEGLQMVSRWDRTTCEDCLRAGGRMA